MDERGSWKVGLITLLALFGVLGMIVFLQPNTRAELTGGRWSFYIVLSDAGGLQPEQKVMLAGVVIGSVSKVKLVTDPQSIEAQTVRRRFARSIAPTPPFAVVDVSLEKRLLGDLFPYYEYEVAGTSLIGSDHQINVVPHLAPPGKAISSIEDGDIVLGTSAASIGDLAKPAEGMMAAVTDLSGKMKDLVADPRLKEEMLGSLAEVRAAATNLRLTSEQIKNLTASASSSLAASLPKVGESFDNVQATTANFKSASERIPGMVDSVQGSLNQVRGRLDSASRHADDAVQNIDAATVQMKNFLDKSGTLDDLHSTLANFKQGSEHLNAVIENVQSISSNPQLLHDLPVLITNLKDATAQLTPALKQAQQTLATFQTVGQNANSVIDSVHSVLPHANSGAGKSREAPPRQSVSVHSGIGLLYNARVNRANPHNGIVDPEFEWNYGPTIFSLGVFDLGGQDRITAQIGHRLTGNQNHGLALRYGYYRGRVGAGADLIVSPKLGIYGNLYDLNIPTMDLEATYDIGKDYALMAGVDSINRDPRPIVGIRIKP